MAQNIGKRIINITPLIDVFEAQEGVIEQIIGKTGHGKTYEGTRRAIEFLKKGYSIYTTWKLILPDIYDEREDFWKIFWRTVFFRRNFYVFNFKKNWHHLDIDRPDLIDFVSNLTDCVVLLDEGQDIFDSYEGLGMSKKKRKTLTRTRHLHKTLIIISQRAQAVAVTARANVQYFYKCVKTMEWPWVFFKIYRTEEMDNSNFPVWQILNSQGDPVWKAETWKSHFARRAIYDAYNSWYLRGGIERSQSVYFLAYDLKIWDKIRAFWDIIGPAPGTVIRYFPTFMKWYNVVYGKIIFFWGKETKPKVYNGPEGWFDKRFPGLGKWSHARETFRNVPQTMAKLQEVLPRSLGLNRQNAKKTAFKIDR